MQINITFTKIINTVVKNMKPNHWLSQKLHSNLVGPFQLSTVFWQTIEGYGSQAFWTARKGKTKDIIICENWGYALTLILLTWRIWWATNNASKWQMGFNSVFKGLKWFYQKWFLNIAIQGPILWQKAEEIALQFYIGPLTSGWTDRFRKWASLGW